MGFNVALDLVDINCLDEAHFKMIKNTKIIKSNNTAHALLHAVKRASEPQNHKILKKIIC